MSVHVRCVLHVQVSCYDGSAGGSDKRPAPAESPFSMFGRDLIEQVWEDAKTSKNSNLFVPIIVEKCINFIEANAMDYEGIYRVNGDLEQSKAIVTLFERGDYEFSHLSDLGLFVAPSITFVLKNYFEMLPNPLLTFEMHEAFVAAGTEHRHSKGPVMRDLVRKLPIEHYRTLGRLMLHFHRIQLNAKVNLMNAQNLGVIFGPILMRSEYPSQQIEIASIGGSVLVIEFLIENAPLIFHTFSILSVSRSTS
ncbi:RhoGAP-domain-containing protein [Fomitiporia mediterranea MF3/22]|uniref:RhoGAP-domain-containing protein n=1 Tax=Fomitiporia mediterranea (strain MF3/22) TaxID=694068 RepID=UPI0004407462|nr:RhoGAP-domain-containing protein [Fomitiporia mediterranea MF3/22]EJD08251.1 RhoGAP-domain-containing protein [Fomitiporia mediterranea MF3/22]